MKYINEIKGKSGIRVRMVKDSISISKTRMTTMELKFHRFILPEFNTHRMFSRNASSSRAIPNEKIIAQVFNNPAMPVSWGANKSGMQADEECNSMIKHYYTNNQILMNDDYEREKFWKLCAARCASTSQEFSDAGYHKELTNRLTESFTYVKVIVTATEWENFFKLRLDKAAQPEIQELARCMKESMDTSNPRNLDDKEWHLPYVDEYDDLEIAKSVSVARCARVSYMNHDKTLTDDDKDVKLAEQLLEMGHMSPFEHQSTPSIFDIILNPLDQWGATHIDKNGGLWSGNFKDWIQYRQML